MCSKSKKFPSYSVDFLNKARTSRINKTKPAKSEDIQRKNLFECTLYYTNKFPSSTLYPVQGVTTSTEESLAKMGDYE